MSNACYTPVRRSQPVIRWSGRLQEVREGDEWGRRGRCESGIARISMDGNEVEAVSTIRKTMVSGAAWDKVHGIAGISEPDRDRPNEPALVEVAEQAGVLQ